MIDTSSYTGVELRLTGAGSNQQSNSPPLKAKRQVLVFDINNCGGIIELSFIGQLYGRNNQPREGQAQSNLIGSYPPICW